MAIVRHLVELHGGTVSVASAGKNQGAVFTVSLPVAVRPSPGTNPALEPRQRRGPLDLVSGDVESQDGIRF